jgi:predicted secreted protein
MKSFVLLTAFVLSVTLLFAADPKPITVATGEEFKVVLESNPSTGNQWLMARPLDERLLKLLSTEYRRGRGGAPGAGGHEVLSFKALSEGKTQIHLKYTRLWERDATPARTTNFVVMITRTGAGGR